MRYISLALTSFIFIPIAAKAMPARSNWQLDFRTSMAPKQSGWLQTPAGGGAGTASYHRPTFSELKIGHTRISSLNLRYRFDHQFIEAGWQQMAPSSDVMLSKPLTAQGVNFPAHSRLHSDFKLSELSLGYGHVFHLTPQLTAAPTLHFLLWHFSQQMSATGISGKVSRAYRQPTLMPGAELNWQPLNWLSLGVKASVSLPWKHHPRITHASLTADGLLWKKQQMSAHLLVGINDERLRYRDEPQHAMQNNIKVQTIYPSIGVRFEY